MKMKTKFRAAALQMNCDTSLNSVSNNLEKALSFLNEGLKENVELFVLPEAFNLGYILDAPFLKKRPVDNITIPKLKNFCIKNKVSINFGLIESEGDSLFNRTLFINPQGEEHRYTKIHLFKSSPTWEDQVFKNGTQALNLESEFGNLGFLICYDLRFPELSRNLALAGSDMILISSAWGFSRGEHFQALIKARAIENQVFIVNADQVGSTPNGLKFAGRSSIVDPLGNILAQANDENEILVIAEIDLDQRKKALEFMNCLSHRVPEAYKNEMIHKGDKLKYERT